MRFFNILAAALAVAITSPASVDARVSHRFTQSQSATSGEYYTAASGHRVHRPVRAPAAPAGASARCADGSWSFSESRRGTCSHHGGVASWL